MSDLRVQCVQGCGRQNTSKLAPENQAKLRKTVGEVVGTIFFGEMLKNVRNSVLQGEYGHGGNGERVFMAQLHQQIAREIGGRMRNGLTESICNRLTKGARA